MKTKMEVLTDVLVIETEEEDLKVVIDVTTGEVLHFEHVEVAINRMVQFINKAKTRYNKHMTGQRLDGFFD